MTQSISGKMKAAMLFGALLLVGTGCAPEPATNANINVDVNTVPSVNTSMDTDTNTNVDAGAAAGGDGTATMLALERFAANLSEQSDSGQTGTVEIKEVNGKI